MHKKVDLLHMFIKPITGFGSLRAVPLDKLGGKSVLVSGTNGSYIIADVFMKNTRYMVRFLQQDDDS